MTETDQKDVIVGRLIHADAQRFGFTCNKSNVPLLSLGGMIAVDLDPGITTYALISNIRYVNDPMIDQLATAETLPGNVVENHRAASPVIDALVIGFCQGKQIVHTLPPRPPILLEFIRLCSPKEIYHFTNCSLSYLQLIIDARDDIPIASVLAAHLASVQTIHRACKNLTWLHSAIDRLTDMLVLDYDLLTAVFAAIAQHIPDSEFMGNANE